MSATDLLKTPLHALHLELGAKMVPFAGYDMPVSYPAGILAEHRHCRESAALFDVSHMGQLRLLGDDAAKALESLVPWMWSTWQWASSATVSSPTPAAASWTT